MEVELWATAQYTWPLHAATPLFIYIFLFFLVGEENISYI